METNFNQLATLDALSMGRCFTAYAENFSSKTIEAIGFNPNSGYSYIYLENGISICSCFDNEVEYLITDFETGEETFYSYSELVQNNLI